MSTFRKWSGTSTTTVLILPQVYFPLFLCQSINLTNEYDSEEVEFSAFILREPQINFLIVPQLLIDIPIHLTQPNTAKFSNLHGVYTAQWPWKQLPTPFPNYPMLSLPTKPSSFLPTFSAEGTTYPIELIVGNWSGWLWFPEEFATHYNINWNLGSEGWRRFVGRGGGYAGGSQGVWTRLEPPREAITVHGAKDPSVEVKLAEGLYIHWFEEKHNGRTCIRSLICTSPSL